MSAPVISTTTITSASGTACGDCEVEVFSDTDDQGAIHEGTTSADATGNWYFHKPTGLIGTNVTATATDGEGNTSEFSAPFTVRTLTVHLPLIAKGI